MYGALCQRVRALGAHTLTQTARAYDRAMGDGPSGRQPTAPPQRNTGQRVVVWLSIAAIVIVLVLIGAQVIPRWWSHRVASVVDGSLSTGALYGLFIGFVFTLVPLVLVALVIRYRREGRSWKGWIGWFVLVLLTAAPNLMTLGIVIGRSERPTPPSARSTSKRQGSGCGR